MPNLNAPIGSPDRPAMIGGIPFIAREPVPFPSGDGDQRTDAPCDDCAGECCCPALPGKAYCEMHAEVRADMGDDTDEPDPIEFTPAQLDFIRGWSR